MIWYLYQWSPWHIIGRDCVGCSKTGSGKTASFALPILQRLSQDPYGVFALVLTPTRYFVVNIWKDFLFCFLCLFNSVSHLLFLFIHFSLFPFFHSLPPALTFSLSFHQSPFPLPSFPSFPLIHPSPSSPALTFPLYFHPSPYPLPSSLSLTHLPSHSFISLLSSLQLSPSLSVYPFPFPLVVLCPSIIPSRCTCVGGV